MRKRRITVSSEINKWKIRVIFRVQEIIIKEEGIMEIFQEKKRDNG